MQTKWIRVRAECTVAEMWVANRPASSSKLEFPSASHQFEQHPQKKVKKNTPRKNEQKNYTRNNPFEARTEEGLADRGGK